MELDALERAVLEKLLEGDEPVLQTLRQQLDACAVRDREMTGVGFFTTLEVDRSRAPAIHGSARFGDVDATIEGLQHGAGFVVRIEDGYLADLEGFSYEEPWPTSIRDFQLTYRGAVRDLGLLS